MAHDFTWAELGSRVRDGRMARGLAQQALADKAGITQAGLARIETGQTNPQLETLRQIAAALGTSVRQLLTGRSIESAPERHPLVGRIARILDSGDLAAIQTIAQATETAETLVRRGGRLVADFGSRPSLGEDRKQDEADRVRKFVRDAGWDISPADGPKISPTSRSKYLPISRKTMESAVKPPSKTVTRPRRGFGPGE